MKNLALFPYIALTSLILSLVCLGCSRGKVTLDKFDREVYSPQYALGFEILGDKDAGESVLLLTHTPWQGGEGESTALFIDRDGTGRPEGFSGEILSSEAHRIVCMSSSHIAMLDALGCSDRVVGVSGKDFVNCPSILSRLDEVGDVGYESNIDYEVLVSLRPDLVTLYGVNGRNPMEGKLRELQIPFVYIGEYLEESPLGKAEWVVALSEIVNRRDDGVALFSPIPRRYNAIKELASHAETRPRIMVNTPYADSWVMPSTSSYMARLIADANGEYVYSDNASSTSMPIDIEKAYALAASSDMWVNVGRFDSLDELRTAYPKFANIPAMRNRQVWNNNKLVNSSGGNDFWESGALYPDRVLSDYVKMFHPELLADSAFTYFKRLE